MGSWGRRLYENDTALEVRDMIDGIFDKYTGDDAIEVLLSRITAEYTDEEDRSVALLVAADRVLKRGTIDIAALYNDISNGGASLSQETADTLIGLMRSKEHRKKRRAIYDEIKEVFSDYTVFVGGSSSFDMAPFPYNKYYALDKYCKENGLSHDEVAFVGDDYGPGGNDESVYLSDINFVTIDDYLTFPEVMKPFLED